MSSHDYSLKGRVCLVTGGSRTLGASIARTLALQGADVAVNYNRSAKAAADLCEELRALGSRAEPVHADVGDPEQATRMVADVWASFGRIDVLFANAGIFIHGDFAANAISDISDMLTINVDAVMRCAHAVIPIMKAQGAGDIIVTSSVAGHEKLHRGPAYGATKHAIETFVNTLRRQVAGDGIRVMSLAPARVANELWNLTDAAEIEKVTVGDEHYLKVEDVAEAAVFMLTRPRHVTIRNLVIIAKQQDV